MHAGLLDSAFVWKRLKCFVLAFILLEKTEKRTSLHALLWYMWPRLWQSRKVQWTYLTTCKGKIKHGTYNAWQLWEKPQFHSHYCSVLACRLLFILLGVKRWCAQISTCLLSFALHIRPAQWCERGALKTVFFVSFAYRLVFIACIKMSATVCSVLGPLYYNFFCSLQW